MADRRDEEACACGGAASQIITTVPESFVRGRPLDLKQDLNQPSYGRNFGRTDEQQHAHYKGVIEAQRNQVHEWNRSASRKDKEFEFLGCAPMEAVQSFNNNVGDAEAAQKDPVDFYKRLGTYMGRG